MSASAAAERGTVTRLLRDWSAGRDDAADELFALVYESLRAVAANVLRRERGPCTLDTGDLVQESFLKLVDPHGVDWSDRRHFLNVAARAMRQVVVDHARSRNAEKRGGGSPPLTLGTAAALVGDDPQRLIELDHLLGRLRQLDERAAEVVDLRIFAGLTLPQIAEVLAVSLATVKREWRVAQAWLARELGGAGVAAAPPASA